MRRNERIGPAVTLDLGHDARLRIMEARRRRSLAQGGAVEAVVMDALRVVVEGAVLGLEVHQREVAPARQQVMDRTQRRRRVLDVVQDEE